MTVELDDLTLEALSVADRAAVCARVAEEWEASGASRTVRLEPYRRGSAFLR